MHSRDALRSTTLPISSVIIRRAYRQMHRRKSAMTSTTFLPTGRGGSHGSGTPDRSDSGERRSLNHSHLHKRTGESAELTGRRLHRPCTANVQRQWRQTQTATHLMSPLVTVAFFASSPQLTIFASWSGLFCSYRMHVGTLR